MRAGNPGAPGRLGTSGLPEPGAPGLPEVQVAPRYLACRYLKPQVPSGYLTKAPRGYLLPGPLR